MVIPPPPPTKATSLAPILPPSTPEALSRALAPIPALPAFRDKALRDTKRPPRAGR